MSAMAVAQHIWLLHPQTPLKAGYTAHSVRQAGSPPPHYRTALQVHTPVRRYSFDRIHALRSPHRQGRVFHAIGNRPFDADGKRHLPPAPTPNWAFKAGTRGFKDMPFKGFLGPSWETADLTRILHRCLAYAVYTLSREYARYSRRIR